MLQTVRVIAFNQHTQFSNIRSTHVGEISVHEVRAFNKDLAMAKMIVWRDPFQLISKAPAWKLATLLGKVEELQVEV